MMLHKKLLYWLNARCPYLVIGFALAMVVNREAFMVLNDAELEIENANVTN
jgi:hypothetical protein